MMTNDDYRRWAADHCRTFGLFDARELEMILSWFDAFDGAGFVAADLYHASHAMQHPGPAPQFRSDHLRLIQAHAGRAAGARAKTAELSEATGPSSCSACAGSGWVVVPHPAGLAEGRIVRGLTMAVACRCHRGQAAAQTDRKPQTLEGYEVWNPDWRNQLGRWQAGQVEAARASGRARTADQTAGPLFKKIVDRLAPRS